MKKEGTEVFERYDELHQERTYALENYHMMLENANFSKIKIMADFSDEAPHEMSRRWFFVCQK